MTRIASSHPMTLRELLEHANWECSEYVRSVLEEMDGDGKLDVTKYIHKVQNDLPDGPHLDLVLKAVMSKAVELASRYPRQG